MIKWHVGTHPPESKLKATFKEYNITNVDKSLMQFEVFIFRAQDTVHC